MITGIKLTKDNFERLLNMWVDGENRDVILIYHLSYLSSSQLYDYAFKKNLIIEDKEISTPFRKVSFKGILIEK